MASIIKKLDKKTGVTYVYESESYWDKEKKQPRSKRKLIGKIDEETGEIVPTGGRRNKKKEDDCSSLVPPWRQSGDALSEAGSADPPE